MGGKRFWGVLLSAFILTQSILLYSANAQDKVVTISLETAFEKTIESTNQFDKIEKKL